MASIPQSSAPSPASATNSNTTVPLVIVTILFFMWGLLTSLNDVLIPHLKSVYTLTYVQAMLVQFCFFSAYFIVSVPAGMLIKRIGYQNGAVTGLVIAASGCALFFPAATSGYWVFLIAFFILASGITILQVAANPYVTVLGSSKTASSRLTLTQAFNSLGTAIGPHFGGLLILSTAAIAVDQLDLLPAAEQAAYRLKEASSVQLPYLGLAAALLALAIFFAFAKLPKIEHADDDINAQDDDRSLLSHTALVLGALGIFLYVGAEVSIGSFLISFLGESNIASLKSADAADYVTYYWTGAMIGRFVGFGVMRVVSPGKTLAFNALTAILLILTAVFGSGSVAMWAIIAVGLFNSIMFPTIFSMALHNLGKFTGQGSGVLCMAIVGGALVPFTQGFLADHISVQMSFLLPAACYMYILFFGWKYKSLHISTAAQ